jgi:NAD(P)-dependent dehydrogenase (short-subunit alcohol dehydrogenase family)
MGPGDCLAAKENGMSLTPPRRYWLTGASSGIGAALAEEILKTGAHLAVSSRSLAPLRVLSLRYPGQVLVVAGDLTNSQTVREIGEQIAQDWGYLDTVILNAAPANTWMPSSSTPRSSSMWCAPTCSPAATASKRRCHCCALARRRTW